MDENRQKHGLVEELNDYVSSTVQEMLLHEKEFFESNTHDKLKVPPFNKVKRIPRDYHNEEQIVLKYKLQKEIELQNKVAKAEIDAEPTPTPPMDDFQNVGSGLTAALPKNLP